MTSSGGDIYSADKRSEVMGKVKKRDTAPELAVQRMLHVMGYRFRLHVDSLPGCPDIVLPKYRKVVMVHGCFWHRHRGCSRAKLPQTRRDWWRSKLERNRERDKEVLANLRHAGWDPLVVWQCELREADAVEEKLRSFLTDGEDE